MNRKSFSENALLSFLQVVIFGGVVAAHGFWLNVKLEEYKNDINRETEKLKAMLSVPSNIETTRSRYLEFRSVLLDLRRAFDRRYVVCFDDLGHRLENLKKELRTGKIDYSVSCDIGGNESEIIEKLELLIYLFAKERDEKVLPSTFLDEINKFVVLFIKDYEEKISNKNYRYETNNIEIAIDDLVSSIEKTTGI